MGGGSIPGLKPSMTRWGRIPTAYTLPVAGLLGVGRNNIRMNSVRVDNDPLLFRLEMLQLGCGTRLSMRRDSFSSGEG